MKFKQWLESKLIDCGNDGCAYADDGKVVKITDNQSEAEVAKWLIAHPHSNVAKVYTVERKGKKWEITLEKVDTDFEDSKQLEQMRMKAQKQGAKTPQQIADYLEKHFKHKHVAGVAAAIRHVAKCKQLTDFLNPNNMGIKGGVIKLFDFK